MSEFTERSDPEVFTLRKAQALRERTSGALESSGDPP